MGCSTSREPTQPPAAAASAHLQERLEQHEGGINCMALSEDNSLLVSGSEDGRVLLWSTQSSPIELLGTLRGHSSYVTHCVVHGNYVVTGSADGTLKKWSIVDAKCVHTFEGHGARVNRVACTADLILSTSHDKTAAAWRFNADLELQGHTKSVFPVIFVPADNMLGATKETEDIVITGSHDFTARTWGLYSGECLKVLKGHTAPINAMVVDTDGNILFTGGGDGVIRSWHIKTGDCQRVLTGHQGPIVSLITHSKMLYSGSSDNTARAWVMEFGECTRVYRGHQHTVDCLRYHDRMLYTGSGDKVARMFEAKSGTLKRSFRGHDHGVVCIEVVTGKLFTGSYDGTLFVWDTTGVVDETVFGDEHKDSEDEEDLPDDSDEVKLAVNFLEPFIHEG
ncbi:WD repeat-containing protein 86 [Ixodes scapularis]|uniref:WD repeat-containing protein 86 n=1 Tax=Ixodes scapularis TaxID=6945 RepID=UPI001C380842|nr:WD repeat-containing protein 86 [Ixodes scapularis]